MTNVRLASLELVACAAVAVVLLAPRRRSRAQRDDSVAAMQAVILRVEEDGRTRTVLSPIPVTIGRVSPATLVLSDAHVSRLHARIDRLDGVLSIRDLDSRNGTLVNARPIDGSAALGIGDEIDVGASRIVISGASPWT